MPPVQVALDRGIGDVAQALEDERNLILLDQPPDLLDRLRRAVAVIAADQLILRPLMPPRSLIILKKASSARPIEPQGESGQLYGMVCPILISVSVTPGAYFFSADGRSAAAAANGQAAAVAAIFGKCRRGCVELTVPPLPFGSLSTLLAQFPIGSTHPSAGCPSPSRFAGPSLSPAGRGEDRPPGRPALQAVPGGGAPPRYDLIGSRF